MAYTVIVIDDSPIIRTMLEEMINKTGEFRVVDTAEDAYAAREKIKQHEPDLVTIDINMPRMDGVTFLRNLMRLHPMPAIVVSSDVSRSKEVFEDGAVGFIPKQQTGEGTEHFFERLKESLLQYSFLLERYRENKPRPKIASSAIEVEERLHPDAFLPSRPALLVGKKIIAVGASTGGVEALTELLSGLPTGLPPIVIVQHIPYGFSGGLARRLDTLSKLHVCEAVDGMIVEPSSVYLAPGNRHMLVEKGGEGRYRLVLKDGRKISRHKPSVDLLFRSVNNAAGKGAMAVIMTGMGDDGAIGMKELFQNGAFTVAQDEASCSVFGMPKQAIAAGAVKRVVPLGLIGEMMIHYSKE